MNISDLPQPLEVGDEVILICKHLHYRKCPCWSKCHQKYMNGIVERFYSKGVLISSLDKPSTTYCITNEGKYIVSMREEFSDIYVI